MKRQGRGGGGLYDDLTRFCYGSMTRTFCLLVKENLIFYPVWTFFFCNLLESLQ